MPNSMPMSIRTPRARSSPPACGWTSYRWTPRARPRPTATSPPPRWPAGPARSPPASRRARSKRSVSGVTCTSTTLWRWVLPSMRAWRDGSRRGSSWAKVGRPGARPALRTAAWRMSSTRNASARCSSTGYAPHPRSRTSPAIARNRRQLRARGELTVPPERSDMARLLSVNVGLPRDIEWKGRTVHTGIWKDPVRGRCRVGRLNLEGDGQGDLAGHGGEQRAAFVYQIESYRYWQEHLRRTDFVYGQFAENFTIEGLPDDTVYIGDRYQIGSALFEVTQPRVTCYRVGIRMNEPRMPALLTSSGRPGFYVRVLQEGEVGAGDDIVKVGEASARMAVRAMH